MEAKHRTPQEYMRMALELARKGEGKVSPNPMVGCLVAVITARRRPARRLFWKRRSRKSM